MAENFMGNAGRGLLGELWCDRYKIQRQLGENGGRRTLLALDVQTQELVVIKVLTFNDEFRWDDLKLFEREAETLKSLSHPAIPRYLDYFELNNPNIKGFALVQTYIATQSMQEHLQTGRKFHETEIKQLAKSLLEVLNYLHSRQPMVIHRDIKPSNILLANRSAHHVGDVYLIDFGSVQTTVKEGGTRTVVGTYGYMPPEQFGGRAFPASDIYSLGATLIYLLTGKHPAELLDDDLQIQFESIVNLSPEFTTWLKLMTHPSLNSRCQSVPAALQALENPSVFKLDYYQNKTQKNRPVVKFNKPEHSKIKIIKTVKKLEIIFPARGFFKVRQINFSSLEALIFCALFCPLFLFVILFTPLTSLIEVLLLILSVYIDAILSGLATGNIICYLIGLLTLSLVIFLISHLLTLYCGKTRIVIDRHIMIIAKELFGIQGLSLVEPTQIPVESIGKIVSTITSYQLRNLQNQIEEKNLPPNLIICQGTMEHDLNKYPKKDLTIDERDWIAQEISEWLGIPITEE